MKRFTFLFVVILSLPYFLVAQEEPEELKLDFTGYVGYDLFFDTYESVTSRDGELYLYPSAENLDVNGDDLNQNLQMQMRSLQSRAKLSASGLSAFGANAKAVIEGDFMGTATAYSRLFRLRHAFVQLDWDKSQLVMGHTWHPMFVTECFPAVAAFGAGLPFNPLNRAPQIRYTFKPISSLSFMGALISHGYHKSSGPADAQTNSGIPELQFQFKYKNDFLLAGFTGGYKFLTPRLVTADGVKTNETIGSYNLQGFAKITTTPITIKVEGVYGQNLSSYVMIGGYGAAEAPTGPTRVDDYSYTNINTLSLWSEVSTNFEAVNGGIFFGYSSNLGAKGDYYRLVGYTRGEYIDYIFRVSPRVQYTSGKMTFTFEYMMTGAAYGTLDVANAEYSFTNTEAPTINNRILLGVKYKF